MQQRGVQRRRAILDAAIDLFGRQGYQGTGLSAIAQEAGITASAIIHHFGSKEGLLRAVLDEHDARSAARLSAHVGRGVTGLVDALLDNADHMARNVHLATLHTTLQAEHLAAGPEDRDTLEKAQKGRAARLKELRDASCQVAVIGEFYRLRFRSSWATYAGLFCGLLGTASVISTFIWR